MQIILNYLTLNGGSVFWEWVHHNCIKGSLAKQCLIFFKCSCWRESNQFKTYKINTQYTNTIFNSEYTISKCKKMYKAVWITY